MTPASQLTLDVAQLNASLSAVDCQVNEPVQVKLLAWVMGLPTGLDPAYAAQLIISHQSTPQTHSRISAALMRLVEVVAQYPQERLMRMTRSRRQH